MPNWCYTTYVFHGEKKEIEEFHNLINTWTSKEFTKTDFHNAWLGNILYGAGLEDRIDAEKDRLRCRGSVTYLELEKLSEEGKLLLDTETAWSPMPEMWHEVIKKLGYSSIGFSYIAEEPGLCLYDIYDPYGDWPERYAVNIFLDDEDVTNVDLIRLESTRFYCSEESLKEDLIKLLKTDETDLTKLIQMAESYKFKHVGSYMNICKYVLVDANNEPIN